MKSISVAQRPRRSARPRARCPGILSPPPVRSTAALFHLEDSSTSSAAIVISGDRLSSIQRVFETGAPSSESRELPEGAQRSSPDLIALAERQRCTSATCPLFRPETLTLAGYFRSVAMVRAVVKAADVLAGHRCRRAWTCRADWAFVVELRLCRRCPWPARRPCPGEFAGSCHAPAGRAPP
jgi:hypothetical protein